ncbi:MAG: PQQ-binding-like beta-propeller repeat protein, partial [Euryarchaeota archaeon]|nr:PQQ-binding-like beta-propeller repeat protein [Euryarchaeota archaeon]
MKKILALILAISLIAGCIGEKLGADTGNGTDTKEGSKVSTQENIKIDSIIFTRTGAQAALKEEALLTTANVYYNNTKIASQNVNSKAKEVIIDFNWEPKKQYKVELQTASGAASSSVYAPGKPTAVKLGEIKLEDVEPGNINKTTENIRGEVDFSPDGKYLVVGTHTGYIKAIETTTNKIVFEKKLSEGRIQPFDFSQDSKYLLLGEQSFDGYIYAFELSTGNEIWKFRTGDEIGSDIKNQPVVKRVRVVGDTAYVIAGRSVSGADLYYYWTRIYAFDVESGRVLWKYPENEVMDSSVSWIDVSSDGKYIAFEIFVFTKAGKRGERKYKDGEVVVLNSEGKKLWSYEKPILPYQDNSWGYRGISFSKDGKYLTSTDAYGAGYLFDNEEIIRTGKAFPLWSKNLSTAIEISGIPIYGCLNYAYILGNDVLFSVGSTFIPAKAKSAKYNTAPVEHPNGNTLLVYNLKGDLLWKWKVEGYAGRIGISKDERFLVFPIAQNLVTNNIDVHGVYVFDNAVLGGATSKLAY